MRYIVVITTSHVISFSTKLTWSGCRQQQLDQLVEEEHAKFKKENRKQYIARSLVQRMKT